MITEEDLRVAVDIVRSIGGDIGVAAVSAMSVAMLAVQKRIIHEVPQMVMTSFVMCAFIIHKQKEKIDALENELAAMKMVKP